MGVLAIFVLRDGPEEWDAESQKTKGSRQALFLKKKIKSPTLGSSKGFVHSPGPATGLCYFWFKVNQRKIGCKRTKMIHQPGLPDHMICAHSNLCGDPGRAPEGVWFGGGSFKALGSATPGSFFGRRLLGRTTDTKNRVSVLSSSSGRWEVASASIETWESGSLFVLCDTSSMSSLWRQEMRMNGEGEETSSLGEC